MFYECKNIKNVKIPNGIEYVGKECFWNSGIEEITLPGTLSEIGEKAFDYCSDLRAVWIGRGLIVNIRNHVNDSVAIIWASQKMVGD